MTITTGKSYVGFDGSIRRVDKICSDKFVEYTKLFFSGKEEITGCVSEDHFALIFAKTEAKLKVVKEDIKNEILQ